MTNRHQCGGDLGGKMRLGGLFQQLAGAGKSERLIMRGPKGRGALDVAVSTVPGKLRTSPYSRGYLWV